MSMRQILWLTCIWGTTLPAPKCSWKQRWPDAQQLGSSFNSAKLDRTMHCHPPSTYMVAQTTTSSQIRGDNRQAAVVESKRKYSSAVVYQDLSRLAAARRFLGRPQHQGSIVSRNDSCNNKNQVESQYYSLVSCKNIIRKYIMLEGQKVSLALYKYTPNGVCCCEM